MKFSKPFSPIAALLLLPLWLGLSSCGQVNWDPTSSGKTANTNAINATGGNGRLSAQDFQKLCLAKNGRFSSNGRNCLTHVTKYLTDGTAGPFETITTDFGPGNYLVATASQTGPVEIVVGATRVASIPVRMMINKSVNSGTLAFAIYGAGFSGVTATVWTCYSDSNANPPSQTAEMLRVPCVDSVIP